MFLRILLAVNIFLSVAVSWGAEIPELNRSIRALGMGGAYASIVTGNDCLYYNPAYLRYNSMLNLELLNFGAGVNGLTVYDKLKGITDLSDPNQLNQLMGTYIWLGANGRLSLIAPYFGLALGSDVAVTMSFRNPAFPEIETYYRNDTDTRFAFAYPLGDKGAVGLTVKRIARWGGDSQVLGIAQIVNPSQLSNITANFQNKGVAYGADLALMYKMDGLVSSNVAAVWHDLGSTAFVKTAGSDSPSRIKDNLVLSYGVAMDLPGFDWTAAIDYRHTNTTGIEASKKMHIGTEFSLPFIDLRVGGSQGYASYGVGLDMLLLRFDAVMYKEELGSYAGQNGDDRIMLGLTLDLGFDADFNFLDTKTGKKLKLKQRR
jgi:hypothetical protein